MLRIPLSSISFCNFTTFCFQRISYRSTSEEYHVERNLVTPISKMPYRTWPEYNSITTLSDTSAACTKSTVTAPLSTVSRSSSWPWLAHTRRSRSMSYQLKRNQILRDETLLVDRGGANSSREIIVITHFQILTQNKRPPSLYCYRTKGARSLLVHVQ